MAIVKMQRSDGTTPDGQRTYENFINQPLIPDKTRVLANLLEAKWQAPIPSRPAQWIDISWKIVEKGPYYDFVVSQKLEPYSPKTDKADKSMDELMKIDSFGRGKLQKINDKRGIDNENNVELNDALCGIGAVIDISVYSFARKDANGNELPTKDMHGNKIPENINEGNWVRNALQPPEKIRSEDAAIERKAEEQPNAPESDGFDDDFDSIPF